MSVKSSLITYLKAETNLSALIGDRIYIGWAEQGTTLPYIVAHQIDAIHEHHMASATGLVQGRFQFDCYGQTTVAAENVAEQVRQSLDGFRGAMGSVFVSTCHLESERDDTIQPVEGAHRGIYSVQQDYMISWSVSVPTFA